MTQSTRGNPPRTFSRFTAPKRERLSTGRGEGAVVQIGSKPFLVVSKLRGDDSPKWREDPTVSAVLKAVARDHGDYRPLTDYRLIKVQSTGRPGWYVYLCSRPQEQQISRLARSIAGDGRSEGVSVRVVPYPRKEAFAIYVWHNGSRDALDWIKTALEP